MNHKIQQPEKSVIMRVLEKVLAFMAQSVLKRHNPHIVGITGSVGKTSTKDAIYHVLHGQFSVRKTEKNYNNEIGVPLTIIGAETGGSSPFGWLRVFVQWIATMTVPRYPEILVLEYGIDRPGDMDVLMRIAPPSVGIVTTVAQVHQEFFDGIAAIAREKGKMIGALTYNQNSDIESCAILNGDDHRVRAFARKTNSTSYTYGMKEELDFQASNIMPIFNDGIYDGLSFKIDYDGKSMPVRLPYVTGEHQIFTILSAIAVGHVFKMNFVDIAERLTTFTLPPGRLRRLNGAQGSVILDDTYNASAKSTVAAIGALAQIPSKRRVAMVGDMLELGEIEKKEHDKVVHVLAKNEIDVVVAVGHRMGESAYALEGMGYVLGENLFIMDTPLEARDFAKSMVREGDVVLVKGSQGMRMEKVVEGILADPIQDLHELCRQNKEWRKKEFVQP